MSTRVFTGTLIALLGAVSPALAGNHGGVHFFGFTFGHFPVGGQVGGVPSRAAPFGATSNIVPFGATTHIVPFGATTHIVPFGLTSNIVPFGTTSNLAPFGLSSNPEIQGLPALLELIARGSQLIPGSSGGGLLHGISRH